MFYVFFFIFTLVLKHWVDVWMIFARIILTVGTFFPIALMSHFNPLNVQNRLLAMNYIDEGNDDTLFEVHRLQLSPTNFFCS